MHLRRFATPSKILPMMSAIALACALAACGGDDDEPTPTTLTLEKIGSYNGGAAGAAEITAYDAASKRLFVVNGANGTVDVLDLAAPSAPRLIGTINVASIGKAVNSVAVHDGLVALAIESNPKTEPGTVAFYNAADLKLVNSVKVGALPDMLVFTPDGSKVLVANEGEPSGLIDVTFALATSTMAMALFSCSVTQAVLPSSLTVMYSGSKSWAALAPGP